LRIHVAGKREYISQAAILDKIRALLLAGIRSAVLWQQVGGSRWQLLLDRKKIVHTAQQILTELT
jgi:high frequency lysogenization protein